jgi:hypothetical protein
MLWILPAGFCVLVGLCLYHYFRSSAMEGWPSITGQVSAVRVDQRVDSSTTYERGRQRRKYETVYELLVEYSYDLDGQHRTGADGMDFGSMAEARAELSKWAPGQAVPVYFDPENRADSTLFKYVAAPQEFLWMILIGAVSMVVCFFVFWRVMGRKTGVTKQQLKHPIGR